MTQGLIKKVNRKPAHPEGVVVSQLSAGEVHKGAGPVVAQVHWHQDAVHLRQGLGQLHSRTRACHPRQVSDTARGPQTEPC